MTSPRDISEPATTTDLVQRVLQEARELVKLEVGIAKAELREQVSQVKRAGVAAALAVSCLLLCLCTLLMALVLALGNTVVAALLVALGLAVISGSLAWMAFALAPKSVLGRTREHARSDVNEIKEHAV
jgi:hypothetical protein